MEDFKRTLKRLETLESFIKMVKEDIQIAQDTNAEYEELDYTDWIFYLKDSEEIELTKEEVIMLAKFMVMF